ncbi:hypothetical protein [Algoriphagus sp. Y33]|uniref:hypothetical protein n=1 Tax=Algoriphagus sp. Y33 TaxID=2772483 RepID=UPI00177B4C9E|nr:hypothetical protein [Algoriphagus sp. Y33]
MKILIQALLFILWTAATSYGQSSKILQLADSLAKEILENEGLYTVMGGLKPISTVIQFQFKIDSVSQAYLSEDVPRKQLDELISALGLLEDSPIGFVTLPFRQVYGEQRVFEVLVYHRESVREKIRENFSFFLERGIHPHTPIHQVLSMTEFDHSVPRFRAYGYFFGYPSHAVDFFVEAAAHEKATKEFVKRDFLQIPVSSKDEGAFVYAVPKGYQAGKEDVHLKEQAMELLSIYKLRKSSFMSSDREYPFLELYWDMVKPELCIRFRNSLSRF